MAIIYNPIFHLFQTLNVADRNIILMYQRQKKQSREPVHSFKPEISKISKILASEKLQGAGFAPNAYDSITSNNQHSRS